MHVNFGIEGYFTITRRKALTGVVVEEIGPFKNIITNVGLERLVTSNVLDGCCVGTGNTPESATDVSLVAQVARSSTSAPGDSATANYVGSNVSPYYSYKLRVWRFPAGSATGNLTEVGVICNYSGSYPLWSRTLIKDSNGNPVTLTVLSDEILDVTYQCRVYMYEDFVQSTVLLDQVSTIIKCGYSNVNDGNVANILRTGLRANGRNAITATQGTLTALPRRGPLGTAVNVGSGSPAFTYSENVAAVSVNQKIVFPPGSYTSTVGIGAIEFYNSNSPSTGPGVAFEFTPPIVKSADKELTIDFTVSAGRHAP